MIKQNSISLYLGLRLPITNCVPGVCTLRLEGTVRRQTLIGASWAILVRLPFGFLVPLAILFLAWVFFAYKFVTAYFALRTKIPPLFEQYPGLNNLDEVLIATLHVIIFLLGVLLAYNVAVLVNWLLVWARLKAANI